MEETGQQRNLRAWFVVAIVVSAGISGSAVFAYSSYQNYTSTHLTVTGVNWELFVNNTPSGWLFETPASGCTTTGNCPTDSLIGGVWVDFVPFSSYGPFDYNLSIRGLTLEPPFTLLSSSPSLPVTLPSHYQGPLSINITIGLPSAPGSYTLLGGMWVS